MAVHLVNRGLKEDMRARGVAASIVIGASLFAAAGLDAATAADITPMPTKAPPPIIGPTMPLDVHGYVDVNFASTRVTGGGLLLYGHGYLTQVETGIALDLYKNPTGFVNSVSVFGGVWNEAWSSPPPGGRHWQEFDWWAGFSVGFAKDWKFTAQHVEFMFPSGGTAYNYAFTLGYDDSWSGMPVVFNPFVTLFYNAAGATNLPLGDNSYRVEIGMKPTISFAKPYHIPLTISFPTWFTVGPSEYWNRNDGTTNFCGPTTTSPCSLSNFGFVTTGLQAKYSLEDIIPKRLGSWYVKAGVQYYHLVNDSLLAGQTPVGTGVVPTYPEAHRDVVVGNAGFGFTF
jgi:hypothetical protein